jgi:hypothetical protein
MNNNENVYTSFYSLQNDGYSIGSDQKNIENGDDPAIIDTRNVRHNNIKNHAIIVAGVLFIIGVLGVIIYIAMEH